MDRAYDPRTRSETQLSVGGYLATINKNLNENPRKVANGRNIHDGRETDTLKDSIGCLTIHPDDWSRCFGALPLPIGRSRR